MGPIGPTGPGTYSASTRTMSMSSVALREVGSLGLSQEATAPTAASSQGLLYQDTEGQLAYITPTSILGGGTTYVLTPPPTGGGVTDPLVINEIQMNTLNHQGSDLNILPGANEIIINSGGRGHTLYDWALIYNYDTQVLGNDNTPQPIYLIDETHYSGTNGGYSVSSNGDTNITVSSDDADGNITINQAGSYLISWNANLEYVGTGTGPFYLNIWVSAIPFGMSRYDLTLTSTVIFLSDKIINRTLSNSTILTLGVGDKIGFYWSAETKLIELVANTSPTTYDNPLTITSHSQNDVTGIIPSFSVKISLVGDAL